MAVERDAGAGRRTDAGALQPHPAAWPPAMVSGSFEASAAHGGGCAVRFGALVLSPAVCARSVLRPAPQALGQLVALGRYMRRPWLHSTPCPGSWASAWSPTWTRSCRCSSLLTVPAGPVPPGRPGRAAMQSVSSSGRRCSRCGRARRAGRPRRPCAGGAILGGTGRFETGCSKPAAGTTPVQEMDGPAIPGPELICAHGAGHGSGDSAGARPWDSSDLATVAGGRLCRPVPPGDAMCRRVTGYSPSTSWRVDENRVFWFYRVLSGTCTMRLPGINWLGATVTSVALP